MPSLSPLHFKNSQDFLKFINSLEPEILRISENKIEIVKSEPFAQHFLIAEDGDIYSWMDVKKYLEQASEKELQDASISFTNFRNNPKKVTLVQLKSKLFKVEQLEKSWDVLPFIKTLNLLFLKEEWPSLNTLEDIKTGRIAFNTSAICKMIDFSNSLSALLVSLSSPVQIQDATSYMMNSMIKRKKSDFIHPIYKDLLKIFLTQELKLKNYLLKEKEGKGEEEINAINEWIKELDTLSTSIKNTFQLRINALKNYKGNFEKTEQEYQKLKTENWDLVKNEYFSLKKQIKGLSWQQKGYSVLKPLILMLALGLIAAPFVGVVVALALTAPILLPLTLLALPPIIFFAIKSYKKINELFNSLIVGKGYEMWDLKIKLLDLETKIEFFQKRELGSFSSPEIDDSLLDELQAEVVKLDEVAPNSNPVINSTQSSNSASISSVRLFKARKDESSDDNPFEDSEDLSPRP